MKNTHERIALASERSAPGRSLVTAAVLAAGFFLLAPSRLQAEDGIRDVERSRGLGDVYKRQGLR